MSRRRAAVASDYYDDPPPPSKYVKEAGGGRRVAAAAPAFRPQPPPQELALPQWLPPPAPAAIPPPPIAAVGVLEKLEPIDIYPLPIETLGTDLVVLVNGKRSSGKTTFVRYLMAQYARRQAIDVGIGMNPTEQTNHSMGYFFPQAFVIDHFDEQKIADLLKFQDIMIGKGRGQRICIILDDILGEKAQGANGKAKRVMSSDQLDTLIKLGRHRKFLLIICTQDLNKVPDDVRGQVDLFVTFTTAQASTKKKLHSLYFDMMSDTEWKNAFPSCTSNYCAMAVDMRKAQKNPRKAVFITRAEWLHTPLGPDGKEGDGPALLPYLPLFRLGRPDYWALSDYYVKENLSKELDLADMLGMDAALIANMMGGDVDPAIVQAAAARGGRSKAAAATAAGGGKKRRGRGANTAPFDDDAPTIVVHSEAAPVDTSGLRPMPTVVHASPPQIPSSRVPPALLYEEEEEGEDEARPALRGGRRPPIAAKRSRTSGDGGRGGFSLAAAAADLDDIADGGGEEEEEDEDAYQDEEEDGSESEGDEEEERRGSGGRRGRGRHHHGSSSSGHKRRHHHHHAAAASSSRHHSSTARGTHSGVKRAPSAGRHRSRGDTPKRARRT